MSLDMCSILGKMQLLCCYTFWWSWIICCIWCKFIFIVRGLVGLESICSKIRIRTVIGLRCSLCCLVGDCNLIEPCPLKNLVIILWDPSINCWKTIVLYCKIYEKNTLCCLCCTFFSWVLLSSRWLWCFWQEYFAGLDKRVRIPPVETGAEQYCCSCLFCVLLMA